MEKWVEKLIEDKPKQSLIKDIFEALPFMLGIISVISFAIILFING